MSTACPVCGARVIQRVYVREGIAPLFVEVYACDAVKAFGLVTPGLPLVYPCEAPRKGIVAEPVSALASMITGAPMDIDAARALGWILLDAEPIVEDLTVCARHARAPTPHELRVKAEKERDAALALAEERRVRLMLVGEDPAPGGWRYFTVKALNGEVRQGLRWVYEDFALRVDNHGAVRASDFETSRRVLHPSATEAWKHAQALRSFIEEHGELPKEPT